MKAVKNGVFKEIIGRERTLNIILSFLDIKNLNKFCYLSKLTRMAVKHFLIPSRNENESFKFDIAKFV